MTRAIIACAAAMLLLAACGTKDEEAQAPEPRIEGETIVFPESDKAPRLNSQVVKLEPAPNVHLNGRLVWDEDRTVRVYSAFAGRVTRILVQAGDTVRNGQALAILGSPEFGQAQSEARRADTDVSLAEKTLQRQKELESYGVAPRKDLQIAEAEYARARAEAERTRGRLKLYGASTSSVDQTFSIASPVQGVVVERNINPGQEVRPDQITSNAPALFIVTNPVRLWVILDAAEKDLSSLTIGKLVSIRSPALPNVDFSARIANIADFLDPATRTVKVRATLDNSHRRLKAEMFVTGEIESQQGLRMQVPAKAVYFQEGSHYAFTDDGGGRYTRHQVRIGDEHDNVVDIREGLNDGQRVVVEDVLMLQQMIQPRRVQI